MNKAFVKDPEPEEPPCPGAGCGRVGEVASPRALRRWLGNTVGRSFAAEVRWCSASDCPIAFYDRWGQSVESAALDRVPWPKEPGAPICRCLSVGASELVDEARAGTRDVVRRILDRAEGSGARCDQPGPTGKSCAAEVRRLFLEHYPRRPT